MIIFASSFGLIKYVCRKIILLLISSVIYPRIFVMWYIGFLHSFTSNGLRCWLIDWIQQIKKKQKKKTLNCVEGKIIGKKRKHRFLAKIQHDQHFFLTQNSADEQPMTTLPIFVGTKELKKRKVNKT